jgi:hypothetical protein
MTKGMKFTEEGGGDETKTSRGDDNGPNTRTHRQAPHSKATADCPQSTLVDHLTA